MLGHFGFSYVGLIFMIMLMVPNIIWAKNQPQGYTAENDFNLRAWSLWSLWLVASFVLIIMYEFWWIRYFRSERRLSDFYSSFCGVPLAGATLPVLAFFLLGIYGKVIWMLIACVILGIGHIGIHWQHSKEL